MNPSADQLKQSSPDANPCGECHARVLNKKHVHGPAGVFQCVDCHDPFSKPSKYKSRSVASGLCSECHQDKIREFSSASFVHGPVAVGMCDVCHDPHASDFNAQLLVVENELCLSCHENLNVRYHFTQGTGGGHPVNGFPDPRNPSRELSCSSCHNPHGSKARKYLFRDVASKMMLCLECHKK